MSRCRLCLKEQQSSHQQRYYLSPNRQYFTIQTTIKSPCLRKLYRSKHKHQNTIKSNQLPFQPYKKSTKLQKYRSLSRQRSHSKDSNLLSSRIRNYKETDDRKQIAMLKTRINSYQEQLIALRKSNQQLKNQMTNIRANSQTRTPFYPAEAPKQQTSIGKIIRDKLYQINSGKISLGSNKPTVEDMDQLLIAPSQPSQNHQETLNSQEDSIYPDQYVDPTQKFAQLMLKLQKPNNQSEQRMIRNEALRVAGKIRQSKPKSERLHPGLYYS